MKKLVSGKWQMGDFVFQRTGLYFEGRNWDMFRLEDGEPTYLGTFSTRGDAEYEARKIMADEIDGQEK